MSARGQRLWISNRVPGGGPRPRRGSTSPSSTRPASQATWAKGTGYIPLRTSSARSATIQSLWASNPGFKVAYTQLTAGTESAATAGALLGPFDDVRTAVANAESSMFVNGTSPAAAVRQAQTAANGLIAGYNQRIGA